MNLNEAMRGGTFCLSKAGLAIGTNTTGLDIAAPNGAGVDYAIKGVLYHKADTTSISMTADDAQVADSTALYLACLSVAGTLTTVKSDDVLTADLAAGTDQLQFPAVDDDVCPIGYLRVACAGVTTFTAGTTVLSAAGITDTYVDLFAVPVGPLTS